MLPWTSEEVLPAMEGTLRSPWTLRQELNFGCRPDFCMGSAHLEDSTEVCYKVSQYYKPEYDTGVLWNDPALKIEWPVSPDRVILSEKDQRHPPLSELPDFFALWSRPGGPGGAYS